MTTSRASKILLLLVCLVALPAGAFWLGWDFRADRYIGKYFLSGSRFAQLELELLIYHDEHGAFPPTKYQPKPGGPVHSWRVLLFSSPSVVDQHSEYDFSKEWNSPDNLRALGPRAPRHLRWDGDGEITHYLAIGEDDVWPSEKPLNARLITKGKDRFLLVEYPDSKIHWMEPKY